MTEQQLQAACFIWHWNKYPEERGLLYMNHNNPRDAKQGASLKAMGMVAGVADMTYLSESGVHFLEFKTDKGRQTANQVWWEAQVKKIGCKYSIIRNLDEFKKAIG